MKSNGPIPLIEQELQRAAFALQSGRAAEAKWIASDILKARANEPRALQLLGTALLAQGLGKDAVAPLEQAARRSHDPAVETQLALAYRQAGRGNQALERLRSTVRRRPPFPPAFFELAGLLASLERTDEAIEVLQQGLALTPNVAELWVQLGFIRAGRLERAKARESFARALTLLPHHIDALYGLARAAQGECNFAEAAQVYRQLLAFKPDEVAAHIGLGACLLEIGKKDAALKAFGTATRIAPQMQGQVLTALAASGHGRFWLHVSDAERALKTGHS